MAHAAVVSLQQKLQEMLKGDNSCYREIRQAVSSWHAFLEDSLSVTSAPEAVDYLEKRVKYLATQLLDSINLYELKRRSGCYPQSWEVFQGEFMTAGSDSIVTTRIGALAMTDIPNHEGSGCLVALPYNSDIPRAIWNPPLTRRGSPTVGVSEFDTPQGTRPAYNNIPGLANHGFGQ
ncbi:hypothetical protein P3S67_020638 [Capsicum chacoense]